MAELRSLEAPVSTYVTVTKVEGFTASKEAEQETVTGWGGCMLSTSRGFHSALLTQAPHGLHRRAPRLIKWWQGLTWLISRQPQHNECMYTHSQSIAQSGEVYVQLYRQLDDQADQQRLHTAVPRGTLEIASRYFLVLKKTWRMRPILNLSLFNKSIMDRPFHMLMIKRVLECVHQGN